MATTLTDPHLGHVVDGRYEVVARIARGGMATVYLATDRRLGREVALKIMHPHLAEGAAGADFVARFRREARAAARLAHPGVVAVFDQGVDGETSYLTMEHVDGTNLRRHLAERGALTVGEALGTAEAILDALAAAHRAGLVHRDIKPENVLLATDGRVKVADFGLARAVTEVSSTTTGTVLGTVAYLAPELVAHGTSDPRTDVYAVGILLHEMLTGRQPFTGQTPIQVAYQHVHSDIPAPSELVRWLPVEVDDAVRALAARDPAERPPHAGAALDLVRRLRLELDARTLGRRADVEPTVRLPDATAGLVAPAAATHDADRRPDPDATALLTTATRGPARGADPAPPVEDGAGRTLALALGRLGDPSGGDADAHLRAWRRRVAALLAAVAVAAVTGILALWWSMWGPGAYTTVPDGLVGADAATAERVLAQHGLGADRNEAFDAEVPAGHVVAAEPDQGDRVREDGTVELVVSRGPDLRTVPAGLVERPTSDAVAALRKAGFAVPDPEQAYHDTVPAGRVVKLSAEAGASLPVGTTVTVTESRGPAPVTVPDVVGRPLDEARRTLEKEGLRVDEADAEFTEDWTTYPEGTVLRQSPGARSDALRGDTVRVVVSKGAPLVEVPDVMRHGVEAATTALEREGFVVKTQQATPYFGLGFVVGQSVQGGEQAPKGSTITLTIT